MESGKWKMKGGRRTIIRGSAAPLFTYLLLPGSQSRQPAAIPRRRAALLARRLGGTLRWLRAENRGRIKKRPPRPAKGACSPKNGQRPLAAARVSETSNRLAEPAAARNILHFRIPLPYQKDGRTRPQPDPSAKVTTTGITPPGRRRKARAREALRRPARPGTDRDRTPRR